EWDFVSRPDHPVLSGVRSVAKKAEGLAQQLFLGAEQGLRVGEGDTFFAYVFLDPLDPPKELMIQWHSKDWEHRAYWGEDRVPWGRDGTQSRHRVGPLPVTGKWVRLEVEAAKLGLKPGDVINGLALTQFDGTVHWDKAGIDTWTPQAGQPPAATLSEWVR